jgi:Flp pilus assembly protein TadB
MPVFNKEEAKRYASLKAGEDNSSEPESILKFRMRRRMTVAKGMRLVDADELPEIMAAVDEQMQPVRAARTVTQERIVNEGCQCEPWPAQMFWFFVGLVAWIVTGVFWTIRQAGRIVVGILIVWAISRMWRRVCRTG